MTRSDLVEALAERFGQLTHRDAEFAVKALLEAMSDSLARGHRIELRGFGSFVAQNLTVPEMSVDLTGIRQEGDLAYTWGTYRSRLLMRTSGESLPGHRGEGKVLFVWKRQTDGTWKIAVDMGNDLPAPGGA